MDISLIIPACNEAEHIDEALDSVLAQRLMPSQIIIIDDGSTDETVQKAESRRKDFKGLDYRIIRSNHIGAGAARNLGVRMSDRPWLSFLDADDILYPNSFEVRQKLIKQYPEQNFYATWFEVGRSSSQTSGPFATGPLFKHFPAIEFALSSGSPVILPPSSPGFLWACPVHANTVLIRRRALKDTGAHFLETKAVEDYALWIWLFERFGLVFSPEVTSRYRPDPNATGARVMQTAQDLVENIEYLRSRGLFTGSEHEMGRALAGHLNWLSRHCRKRNHSSLAWFAAKQAIRYDPFGLRNYKMAVGALAAKVGLL